MGSLCVFFTKAEEALIREMARRQGLTISSFIYDLVHKGLPDLERAAWAMARPADGPLPPEIEMLPPPRL